MTADTSAVVAALSAWHDQHEAAAAGLEPVRRLPAHVLLETYSVLTRLPSGLAVPGKAAAGVLAERFDQPPLQLPVEDRSMLLSTLAAGGVTGGACYDGLVGLEASANDEVLLTLDTRAQATYRRLGVAFASI